MASLLVFNRVYRLEIQSVMSVFSTPLVNCCPSTSSLTSPIPPPSQSKSTSVQTVCGCRGRGVLSCVVDHILQEFNTLFLIRFGIYKIATPPQAKTPVKTTFRDWCLYSSFVQGGHNQDHWPGAGSLWGGRGCEGWQNSVRRAKLAAQWSNWKATNQQTTKYDWLFFKA